jgi:PAS domain S-box-containing protein
MTLGKDSVFRPHAFQPVGATPSSLTFLDGGGEMGARMREFDWTRTSLGPVESWPQSLRSTLSMLLPSKAQIILFWGPEFIVFYNDAYRPVFGGKHPSVLGRSGREAWIEIWDGVLHNLLAGVVQSGEAFWGKDLLFTLERHGFEEETYFDVSYDPVRVESGAVGGVFCIVTETTERVVGERRMALLNALAAQNATARTAREACLLATETLRSRPDDITAAAVYLDDALQSATPDAESTIEQLSRTRPDLVKDLTVFQSGGSAPACRLVVALSPRRPFDQLYGAFLDLVAGQLSTALTNAGAYEAERRRAEALAEVDRAKTAFFSNVSHEFRTPLTLLLGPVQNALASGDRSLGGDTLIAVHRNAIRLLKLVNTLLDFSRIDAGRTEATFESTELDGFTADLAAVFRSAVESAGLTFRVECAPLEAPVRVDRDMWEKIVFNLLSNALKFTFEGGIRVDLRQQGRMVVLTVADTGTGIAAEDLPRVFERFHRIRSARARTHEGTGIGLALVRELVRAHDGTISVDSQPGAGSTFTVAIPARFEDADGQSAALLRAASPTPVSVEAYVSEAMGWVGRSGGRTGPSPLPPTGAAHVLVADDNADMRDFVERLLGDRWNVAAVPDGAAALAAVRARRPDVVVADVMMPELDGFALLAALRADPATRGIPVILLSARAGDDATLRAIEAGADDYLVKPFTARDLLARVEAQLTRAQQRESVRGRMRQIEGLLANAPIGVYLVDQDLRIAHVNPVAALTFGDIPNLVGRDFVDVMHQLWTPEYAAEIVRIFQHTLDTGEACVMPERAEFRIDRGAIEYFEWRVVRLPTPDGRFGVVCYFQDISSLVRARDSILEAHRVKDACLAMLGHELRNPLAPISTAVQIIRLRGGQSREIAVIERQVGHLTRLVDDLLDVSRITRGKVELDRRPIELWDAIARAVEVASPLLEERRHRVDVLVPSSGLIVDADIDRLAQVISNLLTNAAKYSDPESRITLRGGLADGHVELSVVDQGIGIAADMLGRVFDAFVQQPQTIERSRGGLGLGLTIVRSLVEMHGGSVRAESAGVGRGSAFIITLPLATRSQSDQAAQGLPGVLRPVKRRRVLIVDDNSDAAEMLADALAQIGYEAAVSHDGPSALARARDFRPDAALLDIGLPVMDGYELGERLRRQEGSRLVLFAVTGYGQPADVARSLEAGFERHMVKPIDLQQLSALLDSALSTGRVRITR